MSNGATMQAIRVHQYGGPEQLRLERIDRPQPEAGEVLIRVHAAGVLPIDWKVRQGLFQAMFPMTLPYIPGSAVSGVVEEVGAGVTAFRRGDAVFGRADRGSYAEYATAAADMLAYKPAAMRDDEAATISGGATTAWHALFHYGGLQAGHRVLIHGGAGGVGLFAVQFARWKGAHVTATASTANVDYVRSLGADAVIDYTAERFETIVRDADLVFDTVGGETLERSWPVVRSGGALVTIVGQPSQERALELGIRAVFANRPGDGELMGEIGRLIAEGRVKPYVARTYALAEAGQAHAQSQSGHGRGRIVLHIRD